MITLYNDKGGVLVEIKGDYVLTYTGEPKIIVHDSVYEEVYVQTTIRVAPYKGYIRKERE